MRNTVHTFTDYGPSKDELLGGKPYIPLLDWKTAQQKMSWGVLLLMGGGFALAEGCAVGLFNLFVNTSIIMLLKLLTLKKE